jgi:hypothetical protein
MTSLVKSFKSPFDKIKPKRVDASSDEDEFEFESLSDSDVEEGRARRRNPRLVTETDDNHDAAPEPFPEFTPKRTKMIFNTKHEYDKLLSLLI